MTKTLLVISFPLCPDYYCSSSTPVENSRMSHSPKYIICTLQKNKKWRKKKSNANAAYSAQCSNLPVQALFHMTKNKAIGAFTWSHSLSDCIVWNWRIKCYSNFSDPTGCGFPTWQDCHALWQTCTQSSDSKKLSDLLIGSQTRFHHLLIPDQNI